MWRLCKSTTSTVVPGWKKIKCNAKVTRSRYLQSSEARRDTNVAPFIVPSQKVLFGTYVPSPDSPGMLEFTFHPFFPGPRLPTVVAFNLLIPFRSNFLLKFGDEHSPLPHALRALETLHSFRKIDLDIIGCFNIVLKFGELSHQAED